MQISDILSSRGYCLGPRIGKGSYAKVKIAERLSDNKIMAVKIISQGQIAKEFLKSFLPRELSVILSLNHINIIRVYEIMQTQEIVCIMMEYASRGDLLDYIKRHDIFTEENASVLFTQVCEGVNYLHDRYVCHRDLKCENILLRRNMTVALSDFGFSRTLPTKETLSSTYCGSIAYASPELLRGTPYWPLQNDIWSLGCILFIMVVGQMPFLDKSTKKMMYRQLKGKVNFPEHRYVSTSCRNLIANMLQPNADLRYNIKAILAHPWLQHFANTVNESLKCQPCRTSSRSTNNYRKPKQPACATIVETTQKNIDKGNKSIENKIPGRTESDSSNDSSNENFFASAAIKTSLCRTPGEACLLRGLKRRNRPFQNNNSDSAGCRRQFAMFPNSSNHQGHASDSLSEDVNPSSNLALSLRVQERDILSNTGWEFHRTSHLDKNSMHKRAMVANKTVVAEGSREVKIQQILLKQSNESLTPIEQRGTPSSSGVSYMSCNQLSEADSTSFGCKREMRGFIQTCRSNRIDINASEKQFKRDIIAEQACIHQAGLVTKMRNIFESNVTDTPTND
ncbi:unnamed protein product [Candidula unifasciata]|uniref:Protein kinase domain-containing protein n=1 Tax=Candidula unifasciata TaxID=100452 RepID=A0A8S3ZHP0_9EUPU|nr:unnamed protein product [Candidula unifasciata]